MLADLLVNALGQMLGEITGDWLEAQSHFLTAREVFRHDDTAP